MPDLSYPLVIGADDGLLIAPSISWAEGYVEIPDVEAGVYGPIFDAVGRRLTIDVPLLPPDRLSRSFPRIFGPPQASSARISVDEGDTRHVNELIELLCHRLGLPSGNYSTQDVDELISMAIARFGLGV